VRLITPTLWLIEPDNAFDEVHFSCELLPDTIEFGVAVSVHTGAGTTTGLTVTVALQVADTPAEFSTVIVYVLVAVGVTFRKPAVLLGLTVPTDWLIEPDTAFDEVHVNFEVPPVTIEEGVAVRVQTGAAATFTVTETVFVQVYEPLMPVKVNESLFGPTKVFVTEPASATTVPFILNVPLVGVPFQVMVYGSPILATSVILSVTSHTGAGTSL
jgi:hypothetical protein